MHAIRNTAYFQRCLADLTRFKVFFNSNKKKSVCYYHVILHLNHKVIIDAFHFNSFIFNDNSFKNFIPTLSYFFSFYAACNFLFS